MKKYCKDCHEEMVINAYNKDWFSCNHSECISKNIIMDLIEGKKDLSPVMIPQNFWEDVLKDKDMPWDGIDPEKFLDFYKKNVVFKNEIKTMENRYSLEIQGRNTFIRDNKDGSFHTTITALCEILNLFTILTEKLDKIKGDNINE